MRVFVTGGTGAIGTHAVEAIVAAGHTVTALARSPEKDTILRQQGAQPVRVSLFDRAGLASAMAGHDAVVNLASALPPISKFLRTKAWEMNQKIRGEGSATVVDASLDAGVPVMLQESVSMVYPDRGSHWIDESTPADRYPMAEGNLRAEASVQRFAASGGTGIVLRFGFFYGPGARHSEQILSLARWHLCVQIGRPETYVSSIHMTDGGAAVAAALTASGGTYNVVDDEPLTKREYADALAQAARSRAWLRVPGRAAQLFGDRSTSLTRSLRVRNTKLRDETGWCPRYPSAREGWLATAAVVSRRGRLSHEG